MHKKAAFGVGLLLLAAPLFATAQSADVLAQIQSLLAQIRQLQELLAQLQGNPTAQCVNLTHSVGPDDDDADMGGDVSRLQKFLTSAGVYSGSITGHVGPMTVRAIQKWQASNGLVSSGDPDSTGYGYVGPKTRDKMACVTRPVKPVCSVQPVVDCAPGYSPVSGGTDANGCSLRTKCVKDDDTTPESLEQERMKGRDSRRIVDIKQLQLALELYYDSYGQYPTALNYASMVQKGFISSVPTDLQTGQPYQYAGLGSSTCTGYHLGAKLEVATNSALSTDADRGGSVTCAGSVPDFYGTDPIYDVQEGYSGGQPSVTVTFPNGGEQLENSGAKDSGTIGKIQWNSSGNSTNAVVISLVGTNGQVVKTLAEGMRDVGSYTWYYDASIPDGKYKILISTFDKGPSAQDYSDGYFTLSLNPGPKSCLVLANTQTYYFNVCRDQGYANACFNKYSGAFQGCGRPGSDDCTVNNTNASQNILCSVGEKSSGTITLTAPNGGEQWDEGVINSVTWTPYQYGPDINPAKDVTAYLEQKNYDGSFRTLGKVEESGKASIHWVTGELNSASQGGNLAPPGSGYYIRVVNNVTGASDRSDAPFTLLPRPVDVKVNGSDGPVTVGTDGKPPMVTVSWTSVPGVSDCHVSGLTDVDYQASQPSAYSLSGHVGANNGYTSVGIYCSYKGAQVYDYVSVNVNGVTQPQATLQVTSPNGSEQIGLNQPYRIVWRQTGLSTVAIGLYKYDQWQAWIDKNVTLAKTADDYYSYKWEPEGIDPTPSNAYKIYITGQRADGQGYVDDKSDAPFSFTSGALAPATCTISGAQGSENMTGMSGFTLNWVTTNALTATLAGGAMNLNTGVPVTGNQFNQPTQTWVSQPGTYTLTVNGSGGNGTCSTTVGSQPNVLTVSPGEQPANTLAPQGARVPFTRFTLTNSTTVPLVSTGFVIQRTGVASSQIFKGIGLYNDSAGGLQGVIVPLDSNGQAVVGGQTTLQPGTSMTFTVMGDMVADLSAYAGQTVGLNVVGVLSEWTIVGALPIAGATQTVNSSLNACFPPQTSVYGYACWGAQLGSNNYSSLANSLTALLSALKSLGTR